MAPELKIYNFLKNNRNMKETAQWTVRSQFSDHQPNFTADGLKKFRK